MQFFVGVVASLCIFITDRSALIKLHSFDHNIYPPYHQIPQVFKNFKMHKFHLQAYDSQLQNSIVDLDTDTSFIEAKIQNVEVNSRVEGGEIQEIKYNQDSDSQNQERDFQANSEQCTQENEQCHQIQRPKRRQSVKPRKTRTTITKQKLQQMNQMFMEEFNSKRNKKHGSVTTSLKQIGNRLQLGLSTILQKYKQFRTCKEIKGGKLLQSLQVKRKYGKSLIIENYIIKALSEKSLLSAKQVSHYIFNNFHILYSKSRISRHLYSMGFSFNYFKPVILQRNSQKMLQNRKDYSEIVANYTTATTTFIYIDELALSKNIFKRRNINSFNSFQNMIHNESQKDYVSILIAANNQTIIHYQLKSGFFNKKDFCSAVRQLDGKVVRILQQQQQLPFISKPILITDINKIHYDADEDETLIGDTLQQLRLIRLFLPSNSPQLNPLQKLFDTIAGRARRYNISDRISLFKILAVQMERAFGQSTEVYFKQIETWMERAKNRQHF